MLQPKLPITNKRGGQRNTMKVRSNHNYPQHQSHTEEHYGSQTHVKLRLIYIVDLEEGPPPPTKMYERPQWQ